MYRKATIHDIIYLSSRLREDDLLEVSMAGHTPLESLLLGFATETCFVIDDNQQKPMAIGGFLAVEDFLILWMLGSIQIEKYPLKFHKAVKAFLKKVNQCERAFVATIPVANKLHIQYAERLGFELLGVHASVGCYMRTNYV